MSCENLPVQWVTLIFSTFNFQNNVKYHQKNWKTIKSFDRINIIELSKLSISIQNFVWCTEPFFPVSTWPSLQVPNVRRRYRNVVITAAHLRTRVWMAVHVTTVHPGPLSVSVIVASPASSALLVSVAIFFHRVVFHTFFSFLLIYGCFGVGVLELGSWFGFFRAGVFSWWGLGTVAWGLLGFLGLGLSK